MLCRAVAQFHSRCLYLGGQTAVSSLLGIHNQRVDRSALTQENGKEGDMRWII